MKKRVIQAHHISYDPEIVVKIYRGEHWQITQLNRFKYVSKGMVKAVKFWVALHEDDAIDLDALAKQEGA